MRGTGRRWVRLTQFVSCSLSSDALGRFQRLKRQKLPPFARGLCLLEPRQVTEGGFFVGGGFKFSSRRFVRPRTLYERNRSTLARGWFLRAAPAAELWLRSVSMLGLSALAMGDHGEASPASGGALERE